MNESVKQFSSPRAEPITGRRSQNQFLVSHMTMSPRRTNGPDALQIRGTLLSQYTDVYTEAALAAIRVLAPFNDRRLELMHQRMQRRAERCAKKQPITFLIPTAPSPERAFACRTPAMAPSRARRSLPTCAAMDPRHRPRGASQFDRREQPAQRRLCPALRCGRLDVRWRGRARPNPSHVARQPAQSKARHSP